MKYLSNYYNKHFKKILIVIIKAIIYSKNISFIYKVFKFEFQYVFICIPNVLYFSFKPRIIVQTWIDKP